MKKFLLSLTLVTVILVNSGKSQTNISLKLIGDFDTSKIKIFYNDGLVQKFIKPLFINGSTIIREPIISKYARLLIMYPDSLNKLEGQAFLVNINISTIIFKMNIDYSGKITKIFKTTNLINLKSTKIYDKLDKYTKNEFNICNESGLLYKKIPTENNLKVLNLSYEKLALIQLEFIAKNGKNYFYFEKFIKDIVPTLKNKYVQNLYETFNSSFPLKFKESQEGKYVKDLLEGRLYVKEGMNCPTFDVKDYLGIELSSLKLKNRYYIISYWASWCSPCLEKIPLLKKLRNKYSPDELEIISVSKDSDSTAFLKAVNTYKMNWYNVINYPEMSNMFGSKPIPSLYLINKNNVIVFSSWESNIEELEKIIMNELRE